MQNNDFLFDAGARVRSGFMSVSAALALAIVGGCLLDGCINPKFDVHLHVAENAKGIVVIDSADEEPGATITLPE